MSDLKYLLALFIVGFFYAYFFPRFQAWRERSRESMVREREIKISEEWERIGKALLENWRGARTRYDDAKWYEERDKEWKEEIWPKHLINLRSIPTHPRVPFKPRPLTLEQAQKLAKRLRGPRP